MARQFVPTPAAASTLGAPRRQSLAFPSWRRRPGRNPHPPAYAQRSTHRRVHWASSFWAPICTGPAFHIVGEHGQKTPCPRAVAHLHGVHMCNHAGQPSGSLPNKARRANAVHPPAHGNPHGPRPSSRPTEGSPKARPGWWGGRPRTSPSALRRRLPQRRWCRLPRCPRLCPRGRPSTPPFPRAPPA